MIIETTKLPITESRVVFFDNVCSLCSSSVQFILRHNKNKSIKFASVQSALGHQVIDFYGLSTDAIETMIYIEDGQIYIKSTAALKIARQLTLPWRFLQAFYIVPQGVRDWFYDRIARNRYQWFGQLDQCFLPSDEVLDRFLD